MPFHLVQEIFSAEPVECLATLLAQAEAGNITGLVMGVMLKRKRYSVTICGQARDDPTYARGVTGAIDDELRELIHDRAHHRE